MNQSTTIIDHLERLLCNSFSIMSNRSKFTMIDQLLCSVLQCGPTKKEDKRVKEIFSSAVTLASHVKKTSERHPAIVPYYICITLFFYGSSSLVRLESVSCVLYLLKYPRRGGGGGWHC